MNKSKMLARKFQRLTVQLKITAKNEIIFHLVTSTVKHHRHDMASIQWQFPEQSWNNTSPETNHQLRILSVGIRVK
jgi:hypothetical protein